MSGAAAGLPPQGRSDPEGWRAGFADHIETALGERNRKFAFLSKKRLPNNAGARIATGMDEGAVLLKKKLLAMYSPGTRSAGLIARMVALGWAVQGPAGIQPAPPPR